MKKNIIPETKDTPKDIHISRTYKGKKKSDIINFPVEFRREYFSLTDPDVLELPIIAYRIVFKILNDISRDQFSTKNPSQNWQLKLFEDDFTEVNNSYSRFVFKITEIDSNRNYKAIEEALKKLELYKYDFYTIFTAKGKKIRSAGGLISRPNISNGEIQFDVSSYWMQKLSEIPYYNVALLETAWKLKNNKHAIFYLWLLEIKDIGTRVEFQKFQKLLGFNYSDINNFVKFGLNPIKVNLDKYSNRSFNYSVKDGFINIVPYSVKTIKELEVNETTKINQKITQRLHYWKVRHSLTDEQFNQLRSILSQNPSELSLLEKSYKLFIQFSKTESKKASDYTKETFINLFQYYIKEYYNQTKWSNINPNGYPKIL